MKRSSTEIVLGFIDAVNQQNWNRMHNLVAPGFIRHSRAGGDIHGVDALITFLQREFATFPNAKETCIEHFSQEDRVATIMQFSGTQTGLLGKFPATGIRVSAPYLAIYRIEQNRIVESWAEWDNLSTLHTLGHLNP